MHISIAPETLFTIGGFHVTNSTVTTLIVSLVLILLSLITRIKLALIPGRLQVVVEMLIGGMYDIAKSVSPKHAREFFPLVMTIFIFILVSNWMELLPGFAAVGITEVVHGEEVFVPVLRAATADLNTTISLAIISMLSVWYYGIKHVGLKLHLGKFFTLKSPIDAFVGLLEFVGEFSKIVSFAFRLFGNVFAGEVLLVVIASLIPIIAPLPFIGLEIFVGFIQAVVFSVLTMVFISSALEAH